MTLPTEFFGTMDGTSPASLGSLYESKWSEVARKTLKVDRGKFDGIAKNLLQSKPVKREDVKVSKKKPEKLILP